MDTEMKQTTQTSASPSGDGKKPKKKLSWFWILVIVLFSVGVLGAALIPQIMEAEAPVHSEEPVFTATEPVVPALSESGEPETVSPAPAEPVSEAPAVAPAEPAPVPEPAAAIDPENVGAPTEADFAWFDSFLIDGVPQGAEMLLSNAEAGGMWKMYTRFVEDGEVTVRRLGTAQLYVGDRAVTANITDLQWDFGDGWFDVGETFSYDGAFDTGTIYASSDNGNFEIEGFYALDGKQYGYGSLTVPSGETAYVGLVRP